MSTSDGRAFPSTRWSQVAAAGQESPAGDRPLLGRLLQRYLPALRAHLTGRRWHLAPDQADDLLQGFLLKKVVERNLIAQADRNKGRFRTFLLTVLDRYVGDELQRKRLPEVPWGDDHPDRQPCADDAYDQAWARLVLEDVLQRMRAECEASGQEEIWGVFDCRVVSPSLDDVPPLAYEELVRRFGFKSPIQAANALTTAKRKFRRILEAVVAEYAEEGNEAEEIEELKKILGDGA